MSSSGISTCWRELPSVGRCMVRCRYLTLLPGRNSSRGTAGERLQRGHQYCTATVSEKTLNMPFAEYRKMKKTLRMRARIASIPMAFAGIAISSAVSIHLNPRMFEMTPEEIKPILGMDPVMLAAVTGMASGVVGFIMGGMIFNATWKFMSRSKYMALQMRDEDFLKRIQKHRYSGVNKYEDDYYGDKVVTLSDYRQWIRKQQKRKEIMEAQTATASKGT